MTPLSFEWQWNLDYLIFMGLLYLALGVVGCGLVVVYIRSWLDVHKAERPQAGAYELPYRSKYADY
ncbi:MAG: hypothetical protein V1758_02395 [Pseudomonadota bacterium]